MANEEVTVGNPQNESRASTHADHNNSINNSAIVSQVQTPGGQIQAANGGNRNAQRTSDRNRDLSTAKTAQSTPQTNANANRTIGHYVVGRSLGQGTFGKVRLGTHLITQEKVAIKILEKDKIKDQSDVERVTREIHILKIVRHPNVIQLYEIIETSRQLFLIMEYASGGELFDYIVKRKRLQEDEACRFSQQIISGVDYIHKNRICHRDLKPENLLLDDQNNIKIVDFGLSNVYGEGETLKTACGSPCYAAPEMIAGKRYQGLNSDIWSVGIILYAMTCGYLPFEDPNTSKLYKKILNCDYLIPGFISKASKDLIKKVLNTDPLKRITIAEIRNHEWYNQVKPAEIEGIIIGKDRVPVIEEFLSKINDCFVTSQIQPNCNLDQTVTYIQNNKHNQITSTYYLLLKKKQRETGRDYLFEQVMRDKKRNLYSTSNLNNIAMNTLQKIQTPGKIMMHSTMGSGFKVNNVSKSEGRPLQTQEGFGAKLNPATKKYLEQMNKVQKKRTESTAQARLADMMQNFKQNGMDKHAMTNSPLADTLIQQNPQFRGAQSQSPTNRVTGMLGQQNQNQTFFMADRVRKQGNAAQQNRPLSIDEMNTTHNGVMLQSTNDSRIHDMLPTVQGKPNVFNQTKIGGFQTTGNGSKLSQNNQVQMRNTMANGNFMHQMKGSNAGQHGQFNTSTQQYDMHQIMSSERDGSVGNSSRIGTTNVTNGSNGQNANFNLQNQRKTPNANQLMMMTTQNFNSTQNSSGIMANQRNGGGAGSTNANAQNISKTIAAAKLRKQRQNRGASNPMQFDHNNVSLNNPQYEAQHNRHNSNMMNMTGMGFNIQQQNDSPQTTGHHTAISGGRKPTADSHAYPFYKQQGKNNRNKFSNGGGSIGGMDQNQSFEQNFQNNISGLQTQNLNNTVNFGSNGPNTTASRFYNPNKQVTSPNHMNETHSRFMQNVPNNRPKIPNPNKSNGAVQNNFLLPKANPNSGGSMMKTFYNSKQSTGAQIQGQGINQYQTYNNNTKRAIKGMQMHI